MEGLTLDMGIGVAARSDVRRNELWSSEGVKVARCRTHRRLVVWFDAVIDWWLAGLGRRCAWCRNRSYRCISTPLRYE